MKGLSRPAKMGGCLVGALGGEKGRIVLRGKKLWGCVEVLDSTYASRRCISLLLFVCLDGACFIIGGLSESDNVNLQELRR